MTDTSDNKKGPSVALSALQHTCQPYSRPLHYFLQFYAIEHEVLVARHGTNAIVVYGQDLWCLCAKYQQWYDTKGHLLNFEPCNYP
jgi:hypothetical protein